MANVVKSITAPEEEIKVGTLVTKRKQNCEYIGIVTRIEATASRIYHVLWFSPTVDRCEFLKKSEFDFFRGAVTLEN